jgi:hypothetical protein
MPLRSSASRDRRVRPLVGVDTNHHRTRMTRLAYRVDPTASDAHTAGRGMRIAL